MASGSVINNVMLVKTYSFSHTINADSVKNITGDDFGISSPSGYVPLCARRFASGNNYVFVTLLNIATSGTSAVMQLRNTSSESVDCSTVVSIVYIRSDFIKNVT